MKNLEHFKLWLKSKKYNPGTIRNYICDINKYIRFLHHHYPQQKSNSNYIYAAEAFESYILYIANKKNHLRYFTSLAKFSQFAFDKNITPTNIFKTVRRQVLHHKNTNLDPVIQIYQTALIRQKKTPATIKNYINDIQQFINWSNPLKYGLK